MMRYLAYILIGYCSGSVLYAYLLPRLFRHIDIRKLAPDGNPGSANAFLYACIPVGMMSIVCELLKGALPVFAAARDLEISHWLFALVMAAPVAGHAFPLFCKKHTGGKAIAVSFGVLLGLYPHLAPVLTLAVLYLLFSLVIIITPHFFRSVVTFTLFALCCLLGGRQPASVTLGCFLLSLLVVSRHFARYQGEKPALQLLHRHS